jgi:hypothetical protein
MKKLILLWLLAMPTWANFLVKAGSFTAGLTGGASTSVTDLGFTPKVVCFTASALTGDGAAAVAQTSFGCTDGANQWYWSRYMSSGATNYNEQARTSNVACIGVVGSSGGVAVIEGQITSFDTGGFTILWTQGSSDGKVVHYFAMGGSDLLARVGVFQGTSGTQVVSGITSFPPEAMIVATLTSGIPFAGNGSYRFSTGIAAKNSGQFGRSAYSSNGTNTGYASQLAKAFVITGSVTTTAEGTITAWGDTGVTIGWSKTNPSYWGYVALGGVKFAVSSFLQPASSGTVSVTGAGFAPSFALFMSNGLASSTTVNTTGANSCIGVATASASYASYSGFTGGSSPVSSSQAVDSTVAIKLMSPAGSSPTTNASATVALGSDGFDAAFTVNEATQREVMVLLIGQPPPPPVNPVKRRRIIM